MDCVSIKFELKRFVPVKRPHRVYMADQDLHSDKTKSIKKYLILILILISSKFSIQL